MRSFMVVEVEVSAYAGLQRTPPVILVEIDVLKSDAAPLAFVEHVVAAAATHADLDVNSE